MDLGIHISSFRWPGGAGAIAPTLATLAATADDVGCASISVMDHLFQMEAYYPVDDPMLEAYTALGFLAGATKRAQLRTLVTGVTYRHPGVLAKIVSTLDVLSGGRAELGIGAAWYEREHLGLGVPFPPLKERFERLEETIQICLQMWSDDDGPYRGRHYELEETLSSPRSIARPRPPIMIGGGGEKKTLALVAKYADACNLFASSPEDVRHKLGVLREHCNDAGRDDDEIRKTILYLGDGFTDASGFVEEMRRYHDVGVESVIVMPVGDDAVARVERLGEVVPALSAF